MTRLFSILTLCAAVAFAGCKKNNGEEPTLYTITVSSGGNGEASADMETAAAGTTVTLTATAAPYCEFVKWTVESGGVTIPATNPAIFTMPAANVSVQAEFIVRGVLINGTVWALCNVDAPGTFTDNPEDYGMFYQWNRKTGWSTADPLIDSEGGETWDPTYPEGDGWEIENDPCPTGWRVPTHGEQVALCAEKITNEWTTLDGVNGRMFTDDDSENSVFFPAAGGRIDANGEIALEDRFGEYWSATPTDYHPYSIYCLIFDINNVIANSGNGSAYGYSVRCVAAL